MRFGFASRRCLTPSRGWPSSVSAASPGSQQLLGPLGKALGRSAIPRGRAAPIEASQRSGRTAAPRRQSLSPRCLRETAIAACPSQAGGRSHRSRIFLHSYPSFIDRETTAAPEWIEMACRLDHRIVVEVGGDSTEDVDLKHNAGSVPSRTRAPRALDGRHIGPGPFYLVVVDDAHYSRAKAGRRRRSGGGRGPARGRSMSLTGRRPRVLDQLLVQSRHAMRPGCAASTPGGAGHAHTCP